MKIKAGLKGRPRKGDRRDCRTQCEFLYCDASLEAETYMLAAIYRALATDDFPALARSITAAAKTLYMKTRRAAGGGGDERS